MICARRTSRRGFTALEALLATAILAFLVAAVSGALMAGRQQSKLARDTLYASMLAKALMDEIVRLPATDPNNSTTMGPDPGEVRIGNPPSTTSFNCVKDYNGYTDGPNNITDLASNAYPAVYQTFTRAVTVAPVTYTPPGWGQSLSGLLITVTVSRDGQILVTEQRVAFY
jgi:type II secretory pathway pseudopilin PulG